MRESDIIRQICQYLRRTGEFFWRHNNVGVYDLKRKAYRTGHYNLSGVPDIFLIKQGIIFGIEVKSEKGKTSVEQDLFRVRWEMGGGKYLLVRSLGEVIGEVIKGQKRKGKE